jgi:sortase A
MVAVGLVAAIAASAAADSSPSIGAPEPGVGTLPPTDSEVPGVALESTLPTLPFPDTVPPDNNPEPQVYHGRIQIPAIGLDAPFIEGIRISTLDYGPGHWPGTAMPGELGNVVVAGHRTSHNADFRNLDQLQPGDLVIFNLDDNQGVGDGHATVPEPDAYTGAWYYEVAFVEVVDDEAMWITMPDYRHTATLFACHPPGSVAQRIVAHLDLVTLEGEMVDPPRPSTTTTTVAG